MIFVRKPEASLSMAANKNINISYVMAEQTFVYEDQKKLAAGEISNYNVAAKFFIASIKIINLTDNLQLIFRIINYLSIVHQVQSLGKLSLFILRMIRNPKIHFVGKMQSHCFLSKWYTQIPLGSKGRMQRSIM
jgi:hypothetical protein